MSVKEEKFCRLCLNIADNDFDLIDEITREMFDTILLRVNLHISEDPIICKNCAEITTKCFKFKMACIDTEEFEFSGTNFDLKHIYKDEKDIETDIDQDLICRFCAKPVIGSNFVLLETVMKDVTFAVMLPVLMPKMNFNIIKNPVVCTCCRQQLECYIQFVENCLSVEEKITKYVESKANISTTRVKLNNILPLLQLNHDIKLQSIKKEDIFENVDETQYSELYRPELMRPEEALNIKNECSSIEITGGSASNVPKNRKAPDSLMHKGKAEIEMHKCGICSYETKYKFSLKNHLLVHKDISEVAMHKCTICTYETKYKNSLKSHTLVHKDTSEINMHKCTMCTFETKRKNDLINHTIIHKDHTQVEMYKCTTCTYETKHRGSLKRHMLVHKDITEVEMDKCTMCTFETKQNGSLKRHMLTHKNTSEVEMHKCTKCTYETKHKGCLKVHMRSHNDVLEMKMYKCTICAYETKHKGSLKIHMLIHKDISDVEKYNCAMCTYETKYKTNLKKHILKHKDVGDLKMYKCVMCIYETNNKYSLQRHMLVHQDVGDVKTYNCTLCAYKTKYKNLLKTHNKRHEH